MSLYNNLRMAELDEDSSDDSDNDYSTIKSQGINSNNKTSAHAEAKNTHLNTASSKVVAPSRADSKVIQRSQDMNEEKIANFGNNSFINVNESKLSYSDTQISEMKKWLNKPCSPSDPPLRCYVERHRMGFLIQQPVYQCYLEGQQNQNTRFLMSAKKKMKSKTSYFLLSLEQDPDENDRGSESMLGKVRGNTVGSQYLITDGGLSLHKAVTPSSLRQASFNFILW